MYSIAEFVILAGGWRRRLICFCGGACGALALAPVNLLFAMFIPMTMAVWLIDGAAEAKLTSGAKLRSAAVRNAFGAGWWWGFGYFVAGFWWLGAAFLVEPQDFVWAMPLGIFGLPAFLALFPALGFALARLGWSAGPSRVLMLAATLGFSEWLREHVLTGFPWNDYGMALGDHLLLAQFAAIGGLPGLNVLTVAIFAAPALMADTLRKGPRRIPAGLLVALGALAGLCIFGAVRLAAPPPRDLPGVKVRLVQPNVVEDENFNPAHKDEIVARYLALSDRATSPEHNGLADVSLLVWPESAFPFILTEEPQALATIGNALPANTTLVTGAARIGIVSRADKEYPAYFNSMLAIAHGGIILDTYDKVHLVPFGEYMPYESAFRHLGLHHFIHIPGGFAPGATHRLMDLPGLPPVMALICYEAIFPEEALPLGLPPGTEPGLIINVTNDGWFGNTAGPYQHMAQARLLTIEQGLPMLRDANAGISAIVDPYGRVLQHLDLQTEGVIDGRLPEKIASPPFAKAPFLIGIFAWLITLVASLLVRSIV